MTDVLEKLKLLFRPKTNRAGVCANCLSRRARIVSSPKGGPLYCRCPVCGGVGKSITTMFAVLTVTNDLALCETRQ